MLTSDLELMTVGNEPCRYIKIQNNTHYMPLMTYLWVDVYRKNSNFFVIIFIG